MNYNKFLGVDTQGRIVTQIELIATIEMVEKIALPNNLKYIKFEEVDWDNMYYDFESKTFQPFLENPTILINTILSNIPVPSVIKVNKRFYPCTDSICEIEGINPPFNIEVISKGYKIKKFSVQS